MKEWILFDDARTEGIQQGREEGRRQERLDGVRGFILDKLEDNTDKETILSKLQKVFSITRKEAEEYWNQIVQ